MEVNDQDMKILLDALKACTFRMKHSDMARHAGVEDKLDPFIERNDEIIGRLERGEK